MACVVPANTFLGVSFKAASMELIWSGAQTFYNPSAKELYAPFGLYTQFNMKMKSI